MKEELRFGDKGSSDDPDFDYVYNAWETVTIPLWILIRLFAKLVWELVLLPLRALRILK